MKDLTPRIKDIIKSCDLGDSCGELTVSVSNIDDIFNALRIKRIKKISVYPYEMNMIVRWYLANTGDKDPLKPQIIKEGKLDRFLGVDIEIEPDA